MKNLILAISIVMVWGFAPINASGNEPGLLDRDVRKNMGYPAFAKLERLQGVVMVKYLIRQDGMIEVMEMNTSHEELGTYVKGKLEKMTVSDTSAAGVHYARFNFRFVDK